MTVAAIVLYNPDIDRLELNIRAIKDQVDKIIFCDNGHSKDINDRLEELKKLYSIEVIDNGGNKGVAFALNRAIEHCVKMGANWLLTLDQDSICPDSLIKEYEKHIEDDVGILSCAINYNDKEMEIDRSTEISEIAECITSASYVNVNICVELGGFDEQMFIDRVDFEYCYRVRKAGYKMLRLNTVVLNHKLGELQLKRAGKKILHVGGHGAFRKFYIAQNMVYCTKKHPDICSKGYCLSKLSSLLIKTLIYENDKFSKVKNIFRGIKSGTRMIPSTDKWIKKI